MLSKSPNKALEAVAGPSLSTSHVKRAPEPMAEDTSTPPSPQKRKRQSVPEEHPEELGVRTQPVVSESSSKSKPASAKKQKSLQYIRTYCKHKKHSKSAPWKFNSILQTWIIKNVWDVDEIPDEDFKKARMYLCSMKGGARERLQAICLEYAEAERTGEAFAEARRKRAKKLLKALQEPADEEEASPK